MNETVEIFGRTYAMYEPDINVTNKLEIEMTKQITDWKIVVLWGNTEDGEREFLGVTLPEYLRQEINTYLNELQDLRDECDSGARDDAYTLSNEREETFNAIKEEWK